MVITPSLGTLVHGRAGKDGGDPGAWGIGEAEGPCGRRANRNSNDSRLCGLFEGATVVVVRAYV